MQIYMTTQHFLDILDETSKNKKTAFDPLYFEMRREITQMPLRLFIATPFISYLMQCMPGHDTKAGG